MYNYMGGCYSINSHNFIWLYKIIYDFFLKKKGECNNYTLLLSSSCMIIFLLNFSIHCRR